MRNAAPKSDLTSSEQSTLYSILNTAGAAFGLGAHAHARGPFAQALRQPVLHALAALIHQGELRDLLRNLEGSGFGGRVRATIPFLTREGGRWRVELMDLEEHHRRLQDLKERMEEAAKAGDR